MSDFVAIPKNGLLFIAGLVWCLAGGMVASIGLPLLWRLGIAQWTLYPLALIIFLVFYFRIFSKLVVKHTLAKGDIEVIVNKIIAQHA